MSSTSGSLFAGNSRYATDFQAVIDRAVAIASLPISQLQKEKTALQDESAALSAVDTKFAALQSALDSVDTALGSASFEASLSGAEVVDVSIGTGAMEGSYSIEVTSLGAYSTAISSDAGLPKVADPDAGSISAAAEFTLTVGGVTRTLRPASKTLTALAAAINASGAGARATVVNVGSSSAPDYRLSLETVKLGDIALQLNDGSADLLTVQVNGSKATYKVNGVTQQAESDSRLVTLGPGLTVELQKASAPGVATGITITRQSSALSNALAGFANAYNAAMDELDKHRGEAGGALSGHEVIYSLGRSLREMANFSGSGGVSSLSDLGFSFEKTGHLTFNSLLFMGADLSGSGQVAAFFGSQTTGGFLRAAAGALDSVEDPVFGRVKTEIASVASEIRGTDGLIAAGQERVDAMKVNLQERMAAADALIAMLEQQYSYVSGMLDSMRAAAEGMR